MTSIRRSVHARLRHALRGARRRRQRIYESDLRAVELALGATLPELVLPFPGDGPATEHALTELVGGRPTVLVLGSGSCQWFRDVYAPAAESFLADNPAWGGLVVYVREAHPRDELRRAVLGDLARVLPGTRRVASRRRAAERWRRSAGWSHPVLVDRADDAAARALGGYPARVYGIDGHGAITYVSPARFGAFVPSDLAAALTSVEPGRG